MAKIYDSLDEYFKHPLSNNNASQMPLWDLDPLDGEIIISTCYFLHKDGTVHSVPENL